MSRSISGLVLCAIFFALCVSAEAQVPEAKLRHIGFLSGASFSSTRARIEAFRQGLRDLDYTEGKNIEIAWRFADGQFDRLAGLAVELVKMKVDIIVVAGGEPVTLAAKQATQTTPVVMANAFDPVTSGVVASLARPGGNITGFTTTPGPEIHGKQTQLLREMIPKLSRLGILTNPTNSFAVFALEEIRNTARKFGMSVQVVEARSADDFEADFRALNKNRAEALLQVPDPTLINQRIRLIGLEMKNRMPTMHTSIEYVDAGGLMAYGADRTELFRRAATYVDRILKGAKPADLPVEQPTKFELVINLKTAKQLGLTIPQTVLYKADRVIK